MSLKENILSLLGKSDYIPLDAKSLRKELEIKPAQASEFKDLLAHLIEDGEIAKIKRDRYVIPKDADLISGTVRFKANGSALLLPDGPPDAPKPDPILIRAEDTDVALHGDHVLARVTTEKPKPIYRRGKKINTNAKPEKIARVKRILKKANTTVTGTLSKGRKVFFVIPDDPRIPQDIIVDDPTGQTFAMPAQIGHKVIVKLFEWTHRKLHLEGEVIQVLGPTHSPHAEYEALLHKFDLDPNFPESVLHEVDQIPSQVRPEDMDNRLNCCDIFTITIDPDDAKDFDDALSLEKLNDGEYRVGIHIADVDYYVRSNSHLDKEAKNRGNSTYLVGSVIPMLPQALSNGICSLVEGQKRLTKAIFLVFDKNGTFKSSSFANTVISSNKRLTYKQAYAFLQETDLEKIRNAPSPPAHETAATGRPMKELKTEELKQIKSSIETLWRFASKLRNKRMTEGSLDLDMPEVKIFVDPSGKADRIETIAYDESHQLIEEFMLAANETVAKTLFESNVPYISRVHDRPDTEKLNELRETLIGYDIHTGDLTQKKSVTRLLNQIKVHPQGHILKILFLRSLKQACYRAKADGHYGLHKTFYAHFTSPIRRYADLIIHRIFDNYLSKHGVPTAPKALHRSYSQSELSSIAEHISATEQNSTEAERESIKIKLLEFFEKEVTKDEKTSFGAIITDVKSHGIFVELSESMAFGFVRVSGICDDLYQLNAAGTALIGRRSGKSFHVGQKIDVVVDSVERYKRQIDFKLAECELSSSNSKNNSNKKANQKRKRTNNSKPKKHE